MNIVPIQSAINGHSNRIDQKRQSFKGVKLDAAIKEASIPNNFAQFGEILTKFLNAVKNESSLVIVDKNLYNSLLKYRGYNAQDFAGFFYEHNIENKPVGTVIDIADDEDGSMILLAKDDVGQYIEFNGSGPNDIRRFGLTKPINGKRYDFYRAPGVYIDFHDSPNGNGGPRLVSLAGSDDVYYKENGKRDFFGAARDFFAGLGGLLKSK